MAGVAEQKRVQAEIDVRARLIPSHGPRAKQPNGRQLGLGCQQIQQLLGRALGDPGKSRCADVSCRSALVGHLFSSRRRNCNLSRSCWKHGR